MRAFLSKYLRIDVTMLACMLVLVYMGVRLIQSAGGARTSAALNDLWTVHAWTAAIGFAIYAVLTAIDPSRSASRTCVRARSRSRPS